MPVSRPTGGPLAITRELLGQNGVVLEVRLRTSSDMDELVELASRVRAVDGYPVYLPEGDFTDF